MKMDGTLLSNMIKEGIFLAILIPNDRELYEFNGSDGEKQLYELFKSLSDDYIIFHSAAWTRKTKYTVRFGEADYAIYHPKYGLLCLEVKSGGIEGSNGRLFQINRKTNEKKTIFPIEQAEKSSFEFYNRMNDKLKKYGESVRVYACTWFTSISERDIVGDLPNKYFIHQNTFLKEDMKDVEKSLQNCFKFYGVLKRQPSSILNKVVKNELAPAFNAFSNMSILFEENEYAFSQMTKQQTYLIDYLDEQKEAVIQGGAGTGKTMLALEKARRISQDENVLFLCFNTLLSDSLNERYGNELGNVTFTTLDKLVYKAFRKKVTHESRIEFLENVEDYPEIWDFKSIIIDEGQDIPDNALMIMKNIIVLSEGSFYVFYDKNQMVQNRTELKWLNSMDCQLVLNFNCRNTKEIAETSAVSIGLDADKVKVLHQTLTEEIPKYQNVDNEEQLYSLLSSRINDYIGQGINLADIVILSAKSDDKRSLKDVKKISDFSITNKFENNSVLYTTTRKFKGLEASVILLIDVDAKTFSTDEERRVFYVGASRAKNILEIYSVMPKVEQRKFYSAVSKGESSRPTAIIKYLKSKPVSLNVK